MAKFAKVTYGSHGDTKPYTYIVNDSVNAGAVVYPVVTHYLTKNDFTTMGIVQSTNNMYKKGTSTLTKKGEEIMKELEEKNDEIRVNREDNVADARNIVNGVKVIKTGDEMGVYQSQFAQRNARGQIIKGDGAIPSKARQRTEDGTKAVTTDPDVHYNPQEQKFSQAVMQKQLQNKTVYGFETIRQK